MATFTFGAGTVTGTGAGTYTAYTVSGLVTVDDLSIADAADNTAAASPATYPNPYASFTISPPGSGTGAPLIRVGIQLAAGAGGTPTVVLGSTTGVTVSAGATGANLAPVSSTTLTTTIKYYWGTASAIEAMIRSISVTATETSSGTALGANSGAALGTILFRFAAYPGTLPLSTANGDATNNSNTKGTLINEVLNGADTTTTVTACYRRFTRIATPGGEVAVETLRIGDLVTTADGGVQPVKWIGTGFYSDAKVAANPSLRPVAIAAGALAAGLPRRDLIVSPMHGMLIDDVIVPAAALVNGTTITRLPPGAVDYFHIELEGHDIILAEGAPAETFVDNASRQMFDNAAEYHALYGAETAKTPAAPRVEEGFLLEAIHRRLADRPAADRARGDLRGLVERIEDGVLHGWGADAAGCVELEVLVEGEIVARLPANRFRTDLDDAGINGGRAGFTLALPAAVDSLTQVTVRRAGDGAALPVHQAEPALA